MLSFNKIVNHNNLRLIILLILSTLTGFSQYGYAQTLSVTGKVKDYRAAVKENSVNKMVAVKKLIPTIFLDLRYASSNNFTGQRLYDFDKEIFLRKPVADALSTVQKKLAIKGLGLKIFDAYRPYAVTVKMWELIKDERYVANPANGSGHNRGIAVDLTIVDLNTGKELPMGTGFDNFSDSAHHDFTKLDPMILQNRKLLKETMEAAGFKALQTEWWHYAFMSAKPFNVLDIPAKKLMKLQHL